MRKRNLIVVTAVAVSAILAGGAVLASNMGFKLNFLLKAAVPATVNVGKTAVGLPYFRQQGVDNALQLMQDIGGGVITPVASVVRYNTTLGTNTTYTGRTGSPALNPFPLLPGVGYFATMNAGTDTNYIVVGSHDPSLAATLLAPGAPGSPNVGKNFYAPPYNITATNALQLMQDIGGGAITPVANVVRYNTTLGTNTTYTGRTGSPALNPFPLVPGAAYFITMNSGSTVPYIASHY